MVWILSSWTVNTPELDPFFVEVDVILSSFSLFRLSPLSTLSDTCRPQLAPSIKVINYGNKVELCFCLS